MAKVNYLGTFPQDSCSLPAVPSNFIKTQMLSLTRKQMIDYYWLCKRATISISINCSPNLSGNVPDGSISYTNSATIDKIYGLTSETQLTCYNLNSQGFVYHDGNVNGIGNSAIGVGTWFTPFYYDVASGLYYCRGPVNTSYSSGSLDNGTNLYSKAITVYSQDTAFSSNSPQSASDAGGNVTAREACNGLFSININGWSASCPLYCEYTMYNFYYGPNPHSTYTLQNINCTANILITSAENWSYA